MAPSHAPLLVAPSLGSSGFKDPLCCPPITAFQDLVTALGPDADAVFTNRDLVKTVSDRVGLHSRQSAEARWVRGPRVTADPVATRRLRLARGSAEAHAPPLGITHPAVPKCRWSCTMSIPRRPWPLPTSQTGRRCRP